jgi:hypothetical protein
MSSFIGQGVPGIDHGAVGSITGRRLGPPAAPPNYVGEVCPEIRATDAVVTGAMRYWPQIEWRDLEARGQHYVDRGSGALYSQALGNPLLSHDPKKTGVTLFALSPANRLILLVPTGSTVDELKAAEALQEQRVADAAEQEQRFWTTRSGGQSSSRTWAARPWSRATPYPSSSTQARQSTSAPTTRSSSRFPACLSRIRWRAPWAKLTSGGDWRASPRSSCRPSGSSARSSERSRAGIGRRRRIGCGGFRGRGDVDVGACSPPARALALEAARMLGCSRDFCDSDDDVA